MKQLFEGIASERDLTAQYLIELNAIGHCGPGARGQIKYDKLHDKITKQYDQAKQRLRRAADEK